MLLSEDPAVIDLTEAVVAYLRRRAHENQERSSREALRAALRGG